MNVKRFIIAAVAVFISFQIMDYIIHGVILMETYDSLEGVWREDMDSFMWIMMVTSAVFAFLFAFIFTRGYQGKGIGEGIRYGLIIGLLMMVVGMFNQYAVYPLPLSLVIQWFIYGIIEYIVGGVILALIYREEAVK